MILLSNLYSCATYFVIYLWSYHSFRLDADPFLSFSSFGKLRYLLYCDIQTTVKSSASHFGLSETWFNTQSIRMSAPTIARTAKVPIPNIIVWGVGNQFHLHCCIRNNPRSWTTRFCQLSVIHHCSPTVRRFPRSMSRLVVGLTCIRVVLRYYDTYQLRLCVESEV